MKLLRQLPRILRLIPGKAQDLRAWFLAMQYWLGASDDNIQAMVRFLVSRYAHVDAWRGVTAAEPLAYPDTGLYHPDLPAVPNSIIVAENVKSARRAIVRLRRRVLAVRG